MLKNNHRGRYNNDYSPKFGDPYDIYDKAKEHMTALKKSKNSDTSPISENDSDAKKYAPTTFIFDMDGTIIDTEKYYRRFWPVALKHFGYDMSDEQALYLRSMGRPFAITYLKSVYGEDFDYYGIREYRKQLIEDQLKIDGVKIKEGALTLLKFLKENNYRTAIATASDMDRTRRYLTEAGLISYFDELISATMVKQGKPAPDIYLYACEVLNEKPSNCVAVEDSPNGIKSAYDAGLKVIMIPDQTEPTDDLWPMLHASCKKLDDIIELL